MSCPKLIQEDAHTKLPEAGHHFNSMLDGMHCAVQSYSLCSDPLLHVLASQKGFHHLHFGHRLGEELAVESNVCPTTSGSDPEKKIFRLEIASWNLKVTGKPTSDETKPSDHSPSNSFWMAAERI